MIKLYNEYINIFSMNCINKMTKLNLAYIDLFFSILQLSPWNVRSEFSIPNLNLKARNA